MKGILFALGIILLLAGAILFAELHDHRNEKRKKNTYDDGVRVKGLVIRVENNGILDARTGYHWTVYVEFEYQGRTYSVEGRSVQKPVYTIGDSVTVHVDAKDPWKSFFVI